MDQNIDTSKLYPTFLANHENINTIINRDLTTIREKILRYHKLLIVLKRY